jgi:hypothetical protein
MPSAQKRFVKKSPGERSHSHREPDSNQTANRLGTLRKIYEPEQSATHFHRWVVQQISNCTTPHSVRYWTVSAARRYDARALKRDTMIFPLRVSGRVELLRFAGPWNKTWTP